MKEGRYNTEDLPSFAWNLRVFFKSSQQQDRCLSYSFYLVRDFSDI